MCWGVEAARRGQWGKNDTYVVLSTINKLNLKIKRSQGYNLQSGEKARIAGLKKGSSA